MSSVTWEIKLQKMEEQKVHKLNRIKKFIFACRSGILKKKMIMVLVL